MTRLGLFVLSLGGAMVAVAVGWWWLTFRDVIAYDYLSARDATACLFGRSDVCDLARSLCRGAHPLSIASYWWGSFWIGLIIASTSLAVGSARESGGALHRPRRRAG